VKNNLAKCQVSVGALLAYALPLHVRTPPLRRYQLLARTGRYIEAQRILEREWKR
jgi:hypothetical protein